MKDRIKEVLRQRLPEVLASADRPQIHLCADIGWISDPNGLCVHNGITHIFHQYTPAEDLGLHKSWGHYTTEDWIHFKDLGPFMCPDQPIDKDGCYSGSAISWNGKMYVFYTGNILYPGDYDYVNEGRGHFTNCLVSEDGIHFSPRQTMLENKDYPASMSCHVRDPKAEIVDGKPLMVIGARTKDGEGCALLYQCSSEDLRQVEFIQEIHSPVPFGYMWECPDILQFEDVLLLLCCPQGVKKQGIDYENIYQNGYFILQKDQDGKFSAQKFHELDHGFDFYAPQTLLDDNNRRILIGWMGIPDADYENPEKSEGWIHCLTLPRELTWKEGKLYQYPIRELEKLRVDAQKIEIGPNHPVRPESPVYELHIDTGPEPFALMLRKDVSLIYDGKVLELNLGKSGAGRTSRHVQIDRMDCLDIFSDASSVEIFINHGQEAMTTRIYDGAQPGIITMNRNASGILYRLSSLEIDYSAALSPAALEEQA